MLTNAFFLSICGYVTTKKILKYVVFVVVVGNLALMAVVFLGGKSKPRQPMPSPNGYGDFVRAGQMLMGRLSNYRTNTQEQLADFISKNKEPLQIMQLGLGRECRVPNDYSLDYMNRLGQEGPALRQLAWGLCAEGRLAELENRPNDAARNYLDAVQFGVKSSQGGTIVSKMIGMACEPDPRKRLSFMLPNLDAQRCREVAQNLEVINAVEDPVERNLIEEKTWLKKAEGLRGQVEAILEYKSLRKTKEDFRKQYQTNRLQRIQLTITFAERAYELEKGRKPKNLAELVPAYLRTIPIDPFTGTNITYAP